MGIGEEEDMQWEYKEAQKIHSAMSPSSNSAHQSSITTHTISDRMGDDSTTLFVDAALDQENCVTCFGFVFKKGPNQIVASTMAHKLGASTPIFAEGQALLEGLSWCVSSQLKPDLIFTDCLNLASKVTGTWQDQSALSSLVSLIRLSISNFPGVSLQHLPRQLNVQAHSLAKDAIRLQVDG
ncbi:hypothetical protein F8388_001099 [Cannabis sativa]|uniref:RNase H type-1 domain-containing protein n=1 Tax=Cannabis sativa TaxID=3483 RepID=A0A7J6EF17_CANSA|nr:hypothetical protein F8388_001099 [Cannabis sativa]